MMEIGIMQGRLVPPYADRFQCFPKDNWMTEFENARQVGLRCIEWIFDGFGLETNPLARDETSGQIRKLSETHGVAVRSVCADYFMEKPFLRVPSFEVERGMEVLSALLRRCASIGVKWIVLPFVDNSRIETDRELDDVVVLLRQALKVAEEVEVQLHLETSLSPARFAELFDRLPHPLLRANYDSGNSASLGFSPEDEFRAYASRIASVHIKDRVRGGGTVPLGTGNTDFPSLWSCLKKAKYRGDFILQVARGEPGHEVEWARSNRAFVEGSLRDYGIGTYGIES